MLSSLCLEICAAGIGQAPLRLPQNPTLIIQAPRLGFVRGLGVVVGLWLRSYDLEL